MLVALKHAAPDSGWLRLCPPKGILSAIASFIQCDRVKAVGQHARNTLESTLGPHRACRYVTY